MTAFLTSYPGVLTTLGSGAILLVLVLRYAPSKIRAALGVAVISVVAGLLFWAADQSTVSSATQPGQESHAAFWGLVCSGLALLWSLIAMLPVMDGAWRLKVGFVFVTLVGSFICLWPNLNQISGGKVPIPAYVKDRITFAIAPGLDLKGGARFVYTVEVEEAIRDKRDRYADEMRQQLATQYGFHSGDSMVTQAELAKLEEKVHVSTPAAEPAVIKLKFSDPNDVGTRIDERFQKKFLQELVQQRGAPGEVTFKIRADVETQIRERAVNQAKETVSRRVDELGLREASVTTRDEDIIVEVPGEDEKSFDAIKEIIRRTARLEFKMVDDAQEVERAKDGKDFFGRIKDEDIPEGEGIAIYTEEAPNGPGKRIETHFARIAKRQNETNTQCLERFKKWVKTLPVPDDHEVGFEELVDYDSETGKSTELGWRTFFLFARADITGDLITDAQIAQEQGASGIGQFYVAVTFSPAGADRFEQITGANVQRRFAIILDDVINSAPVIRSKIGGGRASITLGEGDPERQLQAARKLELVLRSGALPAPIQPSNESRIGPSLGRDAIHQGLKGMGVGIALVLFGMILYYRKSGVVADVAVLFNLFLQLAILASFGATMTLPGIAGLALTVGMGVDANVLINERIREELRAGRSVRAAVEAGYDKAFSSIIDGHVTVLISGLILAQYGTGPVKGFAVTLIVGILASLYTGVFCTRLVFDYWVRGAKAKRLSVGAEF
jgi:preprotein translocase subunit SecD